MGGLNDLAKPSSGQCRYLASIIGLAVARRQAGVTGVSERDCVRELRHARETNDIHSDPFRLTPPDLRQRKAA